MKWELGSAARGAACGLGMCLAVVAHSYAADPAVPSPTGVAVTDCAVYSETDPARRYDCTQAARERCNGQDSCELPIGRSLSGGKDIDEASEKKVKLLYNCGGQERMQGPHYQNDHASMILRCR